MKKYFLGILAFIVVGFSLLIVFNWIWDKSSTNDSCMSCHYHTDSDMSWKQSYHHNSKSGVMTDCAACHLPPKGTLDYTKAKITTGMKDVWSYLTKNNCLERTLNGKICTICPAVGNECRAVEPLDATADAATSRAVFSQTRHCRLNVGYAFPDLGLFSIAFNALECELSRFGNGALYLDTFEVEHSAYNGVCVAAMR